MDLIIEGKRAALKQNSSFDYVSENRAFSDADDYTLAITLPLAGCAANLEIFGHVERMDFSTRQIVKEASIVDHAFSKIGVITVVEASEKEVKCQFLEGRSAQNFDTTFDDIYINELSLGTYPTSSLPQYVSHGDIDHGQDCVALPWVNDSADGIINNEVIVENNAYKWADSTKTIGKLSYMPYLISITKRLCQELGYTFDFTEWENSSENYLLICNVLPASWDVPQFARALPHWSVSEFFAELEKIMVCEFNIDHRVKHIDMKFSSNLGTLEKIVKLDNVVDAFSSEISYEDDLCKYKGIANLRYADRGDHLWQFDQCQWFIDLMKMEGSYYKEFQTEDEFKNWSTNNFGALGPWISGKDNERGKNVGLLMHIVETDRYGIWRVVYGNSSEYPNMYFYEWISLNRFGDVVIDQNSDNDIELKCVPARIDATDYDHGNCLFMSPSNFNENEGYDSDGVRQPVAYSTFLLGEPDSDAEYYDKIFLAYWDGHSSNQSSWNSDKILPPCPYVDERFSLKNRYKEYMNGIVVSSKETVKISFISSNIPDVRSVFIIKGKKYLCEKITATFTENGMSQLLKGEFYPVLDED